MFNTSRYNYHIVSVDNDDDNCPIMSFVSLEDAKEVFHTLGLHWCHVIRNNKGLDMTPTPQSLQASDTHPG